MFKENILDFFYKTILSVIINYFVIRLITEALDIEMTSFISLIIFTVSLVSILLLTYVFKKPMSIIIFISLALIIMIYLNKYQTETFLNLNNIRNEYLSWMIDYIGGLTFKIDKYIYILVSILTFLVSLINFIFIFKAEKIYLLLLLEAPIFLYRWFLYVDVALIYFLFFIIPVLLLYTYKNYKKNKSIWIKEKKIVKGNIIKNWIIYSIIVSILIVSFSAMLPRDFPPITWKWLDKKAQGIFPGLTEWRNSKKSSMGYGKTIKFDMTLTDYQSDKRRLGGPVDVKNVLVMKVKSPKKVYLRGRVSNFYTGTYWKNTQDVYHEKIQNQPIDLKDKKIYGEHITQKIEHANLLTSTIFSSYVPNIVKHIDNFYSTEEYELFSERLLLKEEEYTVKSIKPYVYWDLIYKSKYKPKKEYEKYLQVPEMTPERVLDLSKEITKGLESDYEKLEALVAFLRNNYKYTLKPKKTPYNRDFVDYFLFEEKEGYCTYFATSLAIMARSINIPTRYVEGYITPEEKKNGKYYVYSKNAHAWVESYIENYGWMTFEATPKYDEPDYAEGKAKKEEKEKDDNNIEYDGNLGNRELNMGKLQELQRMILPKDEEDINKSDEKNNVFKYIIILLIIVSIFLLLRIIYGYIIIKKYFNKLSNKSKEDKIVIYYKHILDLLDLINNKKENDETTTEFSNRVKIKIDSSYSFKEITNIFNKARYSLNEVSNKDVEIIKNYYNCCERNVRMKLGVLKFFIHRFIIMDMYKK
ncbi:MAG: hypothetical protein FH751_04875 [Firmicutes bacterium]|nr:hypothetical protein [Bacillota bacterium]